MRVGLAEVTMTKLMSSSLTCLIPTALQVPLHLPAFSVRPQRRSAKRVVKTRKFSFQVAAAHCEHQAHSPVIRAPHTVSSNPDFAHWDRLETPTHVTVGVIPFPRG